MGGTSRMAKTLIGVALSVSVALGAACQLDAGDEKTPSNPPKHVLMIGNSFSRPVVRTLPGLAKAAGLRLDIASLYIGGCSLERHATNILNDAKVYLAERNNEGSLTKCDFQETWSYNSKDARLTPGKWGFDQAGMYERIHAAVASFAGPRGLRTIPTGAAIEAARAAGEEPVGNGKDMIHLNHAGEAIQAHVWLKALFGVDCTP